MNCERLHDELDAYIHAELAPKEMATIKAHVDSCVDCFHVVENHDAFCSAMAAVEVEAINPSTAARFIRLAQLEAEQKVAHKEKLGAFYKGLAAAAFVAVTAFGLNAHLQPNTYIGGASSAVVASTDTVKEVQVIIYVPQSMENAKIALELPETLSLDGHNGVRALAWHTDLGEGANQLTLPLRLNPGSKANAVHFIVANIEHNDEVKTFELKVDLVDKKHSSQSTRSAINPSLTPA